MGARKRRLNQVGQPRAFAGERRLGGRRCRVFLAAMPVRCRSGVGRIKQRFSASSMVCYNPQCASQTAENRARGFVRYAGVAGSSPASGTIPNSAKRLFERWIVRLRRWSEGHDRRHPRRRSAGSGDDCPIQRRPRLVTVASSSPLPAPAAPGAPIAPRPPFSRLPSRDERKRERRPVGNRFKEAAC